MWPIFRVAHSLRIDSDMLVVRALKIGHMADGGLPPTYDSMHQDEQHICVQLLGHGLHSGSRT
jgi:hypothetical protein